MGLLLLAWFWLELESDEIFFFLMYTAISTSEKLSMWDTNGSL